LRDIGRGQTALITGASTGIGAELARCFARHGYRPVLVARSADKLAEVAADIEKSIGVVAVPIPFDLGRPEVGAELAKLLAGRGLTVDVLVNNAGFGSTGPFAESDPDTQTGMVDLNIRTLVDLTRLLLPGMIERGRGGVLNLGSTASFQPGPMMAVYCASKAFVLSFTEALSEELRGTGVKVTCLCPGATESNFHGRAGTDKTAIVRGGIMSAARVAEIGYRAFERNRRTVIAGAANTIMARCVPFLPRGLVLRVGKLILSPR
jgi:short-subunit dehydrogenase